MMIRKRKENGELDAYVPTPKELEKVPLEQQLAAKDQEIDQLKQINTEQANNFQAFMDYFFSRFPEE
jgi:hypothetical protein